MNGPKDTANKPDPAHAVQGEGDYDAARHYDESAQDFAKSGKVDDAARAAKPSSSAEAEALQRAESEGKSHAKGEDPLLRNPSKKPSK